MMRKLLVGAALTLLSLPPFVQGADEPLPANGARPPANRTSAHREEFARPTTAELIQERALFHARHRMARLEAKRWQAIAPVRPAIGPYDNTRYGGPFGPYWYGGF